MEERNLTIVTSKMFGEVECDFWKDESSEDVFMTSEQLGRALEYATPRESINKIVSRNDYLKSEEFSAEVKMISSDGKAYNTRVFTEDGIYETTLVAKSKKAKEFRSWVRQVLNIIN